MNNLIVGFIGKQGTGKTWLQTFYGIREHIENKRKIYSNYKINHYDFTPISTLEDLYKMRDGIALLDEFWLWLFSRTSMKNINSQINKVIMLNRKRNCDILYTSQRFKAVDIMLREVSDYLYLPFLTKKRGFWCVGANITDEYGNFIKRIIIPTPLETIGQYYNTYEEIGDLKHKINEDIQKGIRLEEDLVKALKKTSFQEIHLQPNSGAYSPYNCDIVAYRYTKPYFFDVKGHNGERLYLKEYGKTLTKKMMKARMIYGAKYYIAFTDPNRKRYTDPKAWYIHELTPRDYILKLKSNVVLNKLIKNSIPLIKIFNRYN